MQLSVSFLCLNIVALCLLRHFLSCVVVYSPAFEKVYRNRKINISVCAFMKVVLNSIS